MELNKVIVQFRNNQNQWLAYGLILVSIILTFGLSIGQLGLFGSQWNVVLNPSIKPSGFLLQSAAQNLIISVFGTRVILYHLINVILFSIDGILFFRLLLKLGIMPNQALASTLLFIVFPAFSQPAAAFEFSPLLLGLVFCFLSINHYIAGLGKQKIDYRKMGVGFVFACLAFASSPATSILEGLVVLVLGLIYCLVHKKMLPLLIAGAVVHFLLMLAILFIQFPAMAKPNFSIINQSIKIWLNSFVLTWRQIIAMPSGGAQIAIYLLALVFAAALLVFIMFSIRRHESNDESRSTQSMTEEIWILVGSALIGLVFFLILALFQIPIGQDFPKDLSMVVIGTLAAVVVAGIVKIVFMDEYQPILLAILIVLSAGFRFQIIGEFTAETGRVESFLGQLQVRGDSIRQGTSLMVEQLPFDFTSRDAIQALLRNWFNQPQESDSLQVLPADNTDVRQFLRDQSQKITDLRIDGVDIKVSKDRLLAIRMPTSGCVEVLDPTMDFTNYPEGLSMAGMISNPALLVTDELSDVKQLNHFRTTIMNNWCFDVQAAKRFEQSSQWADVIQIFAEAETNQLGSNKFLEYSPLLNAFIHVEKFSDAVDLSKRLNTNPDNQTAICKQWTQILTNGTFTEEVVQEAKKAQNSSGCE